MARRRIRSRCRRRDGAVSAATPSSSRMSCAVSTSFAPSRISLMAALRKRRMDRPGQREHLAALLAGEARGDERARRKRRLDDEHAAREAAHQPVAARKVLLAAAACRARIRRATSRARRARARGRDCAPDRRDRDPVPTTAMLLPAPASPPRCAAASMPSASPLTMVRPAADSAAPNASASAQPCGVALRLPTIANAGAREQLAPAEAIEHRRRIADFEQRGADSRDRPRRRGRGPVRASQASVAARRAASGGGVECAPRRRRARAGGAAPDVAASTRFRDLPNARSRSTSGRGARPESCSRAHASARASTFMAGRPRRSARRGRRRHDCVLGIADVVADDDRVGRVEHERVRDPVEHAEHEHQSDALVGHVEPAIRLE